MKLCELEQLRHPSHGAVVVHNLADHAGGMQPCEPGEIDRPLSLARPLQYASRLGPERKDMPGRAISSVWISDWTAVRIVTALSWAEMPVVTPFFASIDTVKAVPKDEVLSSVIMAD